MSRRDFKITLCLSEWGFYTLPLIRSGICVSDLFTGHIRTLRYCLYRRNFYFEFFVRISLMVAEKGEKDRLCLFVCGFVNFISFVCLFVNFIPTAMCSQGCS